MSVFFFAKLFTLHCSSAETTVTVALFQLSLQLGYKGKLVHNSVQAVHSKQLY